MGGGGGPPDPPLTLGRRTVSTFHSHYGIASHPFNRPQDKPLPGPKSTILPPPMFLPLGYRRRFQNRTELEMAQ